MKEREVILLLFILCNITSRNIYRSKLTNIISDVCTRVHLVIKNIKVLLIGCFGRWCIISMIFNVLRNIYRNFISFYSVL